MFDTLLKGKFYAKSKSAIKLTLTRIEMIKRKRRAMQKYLKNDIVDLIKNGLDTNAYGRVEGLWNEMNFSSCYEFVEQCCNHILTHLATMDKQRDCPEEYKEAASSLMFAAARFSDLPELRELRSLFTERYGNSIEFYVNKEFVNKLKTTHPTRDVKLQTMQDIALQSGLQWDSKALEEKLLNRHLEKIDNNKGAEFASLTEGVKDGEPEIKSPIKDIQVYRIDDPKLQQHKEKHSAASTPEEENEDEKDEPLSYKSIPPPYTRGRISPEETTPDVSPTDIGEKLLENTEKTGKNDDFQDESNGGNTKPKPRSVRRTKKTWPSLGKGENCKPLNSENIGSKGGEGAGGGVGGRQHLKILNERKHDEKDEEDKELDRLLLHYSRKKLPPETDESGGGGDLQPSQKFTNTTGRGGARAKDRGRDGPPSRTASLPAAETSPTEATRLHARAASFQPEVLNSNGHVHPKMPEYDDFVARLAELRGTLN